jgi:uncharacterized protein (DUF433 family)
MKHRITVDATVHFGKPCVSGTRITVLDVLELVREGLSFDDIMHNYYPDLEVEGIQACFRYAMDVIAAEDIRRR